MVQHAVNLPSNMACIGFANVSFSKTRDSLFFRKLLKNGTEFVRPISPLNPALGEILRIESGKRLPAPPRPGSGGRLEDHLRYTAEGRVC